MSTSTIKESLVEAEILTQDLGIEADLLAFQQQHSARLQQKKQ